MIIQNYNQLENMYVLPQVDPIVPEAHRYKLLSFQDKVYSIVLRSSANNVFNNNDKFYIIQVLQTANDQFYTWTRWGRIGVPGQYALGGPTSKSQSIRLYNKKYLDKTSNGLYKQFSTFHNSLKILKSQDNSSLNSKSQIINIENKIDSNPLTISFNENDFYSLINSENIPAKCPENHQIYSFCLNSECKDQFGFLCRQQNCNTCQKYHPVCKTAKITTILDKIKSKVEYLEYYKKNLIMIFQKTIDNLSEILNKKLNHLNKMQATLKHSQITQCEKKFINFLSNKFSKESFFESSERSTLWENFTNKTTQKIDPFTKLQACMRSFNDNISKEISTFEYKFDKILDNQNLSKHSLFIGQSAIITNKELENNLVSFFENPIKSSKVIFRASENQFKLQNWIEKVKDLPNTITICKTKKNKILGGFTPLAFSISNLAHNLPILDPSDLSFLFSLSRNEKYPLKKKCPAIEIRKKLDFILFGNLRGQLAICNYANTNFSFSSQLGTNYQFPGNFNTIEGYESLTGYQNQRFLIQEWQVLQIEFVSPMNTINKQSLIQNKDQQK